MATVHVIASLEIGGAQKLLSELLPALKRQGEDVSLIVYQRLGNFLEKRIEQSGIPIHSLDVKNTRSLDLIPALRSALKPYSDIHVHLFPALYHTALAAMGTRQRLYYTEHSTSNRRRKKRFIRSIEQYVYGRYKKIVAISDAAHEALVSWLGKKYDEKMVTVENGIDLEKIRTASPSAQFPNQRYILMVSRFVVQKDQQTLIKAIPYVDDKEVLFFFVGEGPTMDECKALAEKKDVSDRCVFLGARDDVPELIAGSIMGVQSSKIEGFGLTAVEFMAAGKPVIGSDVPGLVNVVGDEERIFKAGDHKKLAEKINMVLKNPTPNKTDISAYDIEHTARRYRDLYH